MGLEKRSEDFGQTMGVWGMDTGPYLVLPFLGPSSVRLIDVGTGMGLETLSARGRTSFRIPCGSLGSAIGSTQRLVCVQSTIGPTSFQAIGFWGLRRSTSTLMSGMPICSAAGVRSTTATRPISTPNYSRGSERWLRSRIRRERIRSPAGRPKGARHEWRATAPPLPADYSSAPVNRRNLAVRTPLP